MKMLGPPAIWYHRPMRLLCLLCLVATPAFGWQVSTDGAVCVLSHELPDGDLRLTFDDAAPEYSITLTRQEPWQKAPLFAIRFEPDQPILISTDRHQLNPDMTALTVTDRGFGNVLDGLQFNQWAIAGTGETAMIIPLARAAPAVQAFRDCSSSLAI